MQVFDKRSLPERTPPRDDRKAYLLNLNPRAMRAFKLAGIEIDQLIEPHKGAVGMFLPDLFLVFSRTWPADRIVLTAQ